MDHRFDIRRRRLLVTTAAALGVAAAPRAPAIVAAERARPLAAQGLQFGDPREGSVMVWCRSDRPARLLVEYSLDERFANATRIVGPHALAGSDYTVRQELAGLPPGRELFVRASLQGLDGGTLSEPLLGRLRTPGGDGPIRLVWGGDTAGQGWGINPGFGGMRIFDAMRRRRPHFFIHSGDTVYADVPIHASKEAEDGRIWTNLVIPEVQKVAETLGEFRGRYRYNLLDDNVRRFNAEVPQIWQWDDHEVVNNWSPGKDLADSERYGEKRVALLRARGTRAFLEYAPLRPFAAPHGGRIYRSFAQGPLLELFVIDMRGRRGPNSYNRQAEPGLDTALLGREQLDWLKRGLARSRAVWKLIAADMSLGLAIGDGRDAAGRRRYDGPANGDGPVLGREFEIAELLAHIRREQVANAVWLTADVHYCAAHHYHPGRARHAEFEPFWEFVAGPLNAGSFGPRALDDTFGPQVVFQKAAPPGRSGLSPYAGLQFFGEVNIDAENGLTVDLRDIEGSSLFSRTLVPEPGRPRR